MKASSIQICLETKRHHCVTNGFLKEFKTHVIIPCTKLFGRVSQILDSDYKKNLKMPKGVIRIRISKLLVKFQSDDFNLTITETITELYSIV
jgi:hypothetical protein